MRVLRYVQAFVLFPFAWCERKIKAAEATPTRGKDYKAERRYLRLGIMFLYLYGFLAIYAAQWLWVRVSSLWR